MTKILQLYDSYERLACEREREKKKLCFNWVGHNDKQELLFSYLYTHFEYGAHRSKRNRNLFAVSPSMAFSTFYVDT